MAPQVDKNSFLKALAELGHDPRDYIGQRLSLEQMAGLYEMDQDAIIEAIDMKQIAAHYDYMSDTVWINALDAAHFYFTIRNEAHLYSAG